MDEYAGAPPLLLSAEQHDGGEEAAALSLEERFAAITHELMCDQINVGEALLGFGPAAATLNLSPTGDPTEAAAHLFAMLRALDRPEFTGIAVMPIPEDGLGLAINDRLRRAAAPREAS